VAKSNLWSVLHSVFPISNTYSKAGLSIRIIGGQQAPNLVVFFYDLTRINKVDMVAIVEPRIGEVNTDKVSQNGCSRFLRWFMDSWERHC